MSDFTRVIRNTFYLYIRTGISVLIVLYTTRVILQCLGVVDFGIYNIVGGVISMLGFLNSSMAVTIQRFLNYEEGKGNMEKQKTIFNIGIVLHVFIALLITLFFVLFGGLFFNGILNVPPERMDAAKVVYACLIVSTVFTILTVPYDACLNAHENMFFYSIVGIGESFLKLGVALWMIHTSGDRLITYSVLMAFIPILSMTIMRIYCRIHYAECRVSIRAYYDKKTAKDIISFAGWNLMGNASGSLGNYGNMIAMNHYWGTGMNTVMGIANQLQGQLMVLSSGMLKALNPIIAKKEGRGDSQSMLDYAIRGCELSFFLLALAAVPFYIYTPLILQAWLGDFPDWTVLFVRLQLIRALLEQLTASLNKALEAKNRIVILNLSTFILNLVTVPILCFVYNIGLQPYWHYIIAIPFMVIIPSIIKIELCCRYCGLSGLDILKNLIIPISKYLICIIVPIIIVNNLFTHGASQCVLILIINLFIILVVVYQSLDSSMRSTIKTFLNSLVIR